jgi:hypothetical protein
MAKLVTYRCPDCEGEFDFLHHPSDEPPPERCQLCNAYMGDQPQKAPVLVLKIGTAKGKVPDKLYRDMEESSRVRAQQAAEMAGVSESEMSAIKITDMKDNLRQGDVAAKPSVDIDAARKRLSYNVGGHQVGPEVQNTMAAQWGGQTQVKDPKRSRRAG